MNKKKKFLVFNPKKGFEIKEMESLLKNYYEIIETDVIDCVTVKIGKTDYEVVCDDEGLLKDNPILSFALSQHRALFGILVFTRHKNSEWIGLTDDEINEIKENTILVECAGGCNRYALVNKNSKGKSVL
ncbi:MAG: hypothetical protein FWE36_08435 [Erysipelotrichales bacterium]|nr:hypothetical protein [Erysipelotrichales bacterium]